MPKKSSSQTFDYKKDLVLGQLYSSEHKEATRGLIYFVPLNLDRPDIIHIAANIVHYTSSGDVEIQDEAALDVAYMDIFYSDPVEISDNERTKLQLKGVRLPCYTK